MPIKTRDEHKTALNNLLGMIAPDRQGEASAILTDLSDNYEQTVTESENNASRVSELTKNNETLRKVNADLFLKVGQTHNETRNNPPTPTQNQTVPSGGEPPKPEMTFDKLFNEKGDLM